MKKVKVTKEMISDTISSTVDEVLDKDIDNALELLNKKETSNAHPVRYIMNDKIRKDNDNKVHTSYNNKPIIIETQPMDNILNQFATKSDVDKLKIIMSTLLDLTLEDVKKNFKFFREYLNGLKTLSDLCKVKTLLNEIKLRDENRIEQLIKATENIEL